MAKSTVNHRPQTRSLTSSLRPKSTKGSTGGGTTKVSKTTKKAKKASTTAPDNDYFETIIGFLEGLQNNLHTIQENAASGCPCLLRPSTGTHQQIDISRTGAHQQDGSSGEKNKEGGGEANGAPQSSTGQNSKAIPEKVPYLDYPQSVKQRIDKTPGEVWKDLYIYWSSHRLLDPREFVHIGSSEWIPTEDAIDAIKSVTEAITRQGGETFSPWTREAFVAWRTEKSPQQVFINSEEYQIASRNPQDRLLMPFWIPLTNKGTSKDDALKALFEGGTTEGFRHTVLLEMLLDSDGKTQGTTIRFYDSAEDKLFARHAGVYTREVADLLSVGLWGPHNWYEEFQCAKQDEGSTVCTVHAIVNGWGRAFNLELNSEFEASDRFYEEAVRMINLALPDISTQPLYMLG